MKKKNKLIKINKKIIIINILLIAFLVVFFSLYRVFNSVSVDEKPVRSIKETAIYEDYVSRDLDLSIRYPENWIVQEKDLSIHLASSSKGEELNETSRRARVEIYIRDANLCQPTIDEEFEKGGCGEVNGISKDRIEKETFNLKSGRLYKYIISYKQNSHQTFYYLEKGNRLLQISKTPDPSEYDREIEDIISSIQFL